MAGENPFNLDGRTALVAGASRGIGLAIARAMARAGAHTVLAARSIDALEAAARELRAEGLAAEAAAFDMTDRSSIDQLAERYPATDILINVSGTNRRRRVESYAEAEYDLIMNTNLKGLFQLTQAAGARMRERKRGKVINIGSLTSLAGLPYIAVYAMSKSGLAGMTRALAAEWGRDNIQVNCIAPGFILTDLNRDMWQPEAMHEWRRGTQANPHMGSPEDIAPLAVFLAGAGADYITGQVIAVDGGYSTTAVWPFEP